MATARLTEAQRKVLDYLSSAGHATERLIAVRVFSRPLTTDGRPMMLGIASTMNALHRRKLVKQRPVAASSMTGRGWEITRAGRKAVEV
jgi:hypothetical protein